MRTTTANVLRFALALAISTAALGQDAAPAPSPLELDRRLRELESRQTTKEGEKDKPGAKLQADGSGFSLASADGSYSLKLRGYIHFDARVFGDEGTVVTIDTFTLRRVRPIFEGSLGKYVDFRIMPDFGGVSTTLQDAYAELKFAPWLKVRGGKFKPPAGLERLQSATDLAFVERALPTNLVPNRDLGVQFAGDLWGGVVAYQAGVFNGVVDGGSADADANDSKDVAGRVWLSPFKRRESWLKDLSFGVFATSGTNRGAYSASNATAPALPVYRSAGQLVFFSYRTRATAADTVIAAGDRQRFGAQGQFQGGRVALQAEWVRSSQEVALAVNRADLEHEAWQATLQFTLTRDRARLRGFVPSKPFDTAARQFGALELKLRVGRLEIDDDAFPIFADPASAQRLAEETGAGLNWYLTRNVKFMLDGVRTEFESFGAATPRKAEKVLLSRVQLSF